VRRRIESVLKEVYRPKRVFSLAEANRTLPLVSRIIRDVVRAAGAMGRVRARILAMNAAGLRERAEEEGRRLDALEQEVEGFVREIEEIGCVLKDPEVGLVDFPARHGGKTVFLCWKMGEREILFYHDLDAGFAGRKPVRGLFDRA
jgi:hypothetical protein